MAGQWATLLSEMWHQSACFVSKALPKETAFRRILQESAIGNGCSYSRDPIAQQSRAAWAYPSPSALSRRAVSVAADRCPCPDAVQMRWIAWGKANFVRAVEEVNFGCGSILRQGFGALDPAASGEGTAKSRDQARPREDHVQGQRQLSDSDPNLCPDQSTGPVGGNVKSARADGGANAWLRKPPRDAKRTPRDNSDQAAAFIASADLAAVVALAHQTISSRSAVAPGRRCASILLMSPLPPPIGWTANMSAPPI